MKAKANPSAAVTEALRINGTVVFVGHARLPQSLAPRDSSPVVSVELETDVSSGEIIGVGAKAVADLGTRLLISVLVGHNINECPTNMVEEIRRRYICPSQKAMSTAVLNAFEAYERYRQAGMQLTDAALKQGEERQLQEPDGVLGNESASTKDHPAPADELKDVAEVAALLRENGRHSRRVGKELKVAAGASWFFPDNHGRGVRRA